MVWKEFITTFVTIFVAEMGDKTQFAALASSANASSRISVLLGVIAGLSIAGALGVAVGAWSKGIFSPEVMKYTSGILFIALGIWTLVS